MMHSVLIVDDKAENLYFLGALLQGNGFTVRSANNGAEALASAMKDPPDLIVSDILMPVMDGYTLCRQWRANDCLKEIPFIFYTAAYTEKKDGELALGLGADRYVIKPQEPEVLMTVIREVLANSGRGEVRTCPEASQSEQKMLKDYNEVLFGKLEKKMADLGQARLELQESEGHFRQFIMECPIPIAINRPDGTIELVNNRFVETLGYTVDDIPTVESWWLLAYPDPVYRQEAIRTWQSAAEKTLRDGAVRGVDEYRVTCKDGTVRTMEIFGAAIANSLLVIFNDLTERKRAEDVLRESERRFRTVLETMSLLAVMLDRTGMITLCNDFLLELTGWKRDEVIGQDWFTLFLPHEIQDSIKAEVFLKGIAAGEIPPHFENEIVTRSGERRLIKWNNSTLQDHVGAFVGVTSIGEDITDRKATEASLRESEGLYRQIAAEWEQRVNERTAQLESANKELEAFAYSVSHDLRAPLRAIEGFSGIVVEDYGERLDEEGRRLLGVIRANATRMSQLIDDLLVFSRTGRSELKRKRLDMEAMVRSVFAEVVGDPAARARIECKIGELPGAEGDPALVRQVWVNLLSNAVKFSGHEERAEIEVAGAHEGSQSVYHVRDNGVGFDMQYAGKLFGVFQRLHALDQFEGTGIGLALVQRIVARHGGRVWAQGAVGRGATFSFSLPAG